MIRRPGLGAEVLGFAPLAAPAPFVVGSSEARAQIRSSDYFRYTANARRHGIVDNSFNPIPESHEYALLSGAGLLGFARWRRRGGAKG
jgi:hypothetical protein